MKKLQARGHFHFKDKIMTSNNKGETIVEVMVAFVLLVLYLGIISTMVTAALRITNISTQKADAFQEAINEIVEQQSDTAAMPMKLTFTVVSQEGPGTDLITTVQQEVRYISHPHVVYFEPVVR